MSATKTFPNENASPPQQQQNTNSPSLLTRLTSQQRLQQQQAQHREPNPPSYRDDYQNPSFAHHKSSYKPFSTNSSPQEGYKSPFDNSNRTQMNPNVKQEYREYNNQENSNNPTYLSRFTAYDTAYSNIEEELGGQEWIRKTSRQRRFTNGSLPIVHAREEKALEETKTDGDDQIRDQVLYELTEQMDDMSGYVSNFVERKEEELAMLAEMFDDEGNPIQRYDEEGNPIPFNDEDGYPIRTEEILPQKKMTVKIDMSQMQSKEGWMWKKGAGGGLFKRTNWRKRYFKFDSQKPVIVYYWKDKPTAIPDRQPNETDYTYKLRRDRAIAHERRDARGVMNLMYAKVVIPDPPRVHKQKNILGDFEFDLVSSDNSRTFTLFAEKKDEYDKWIQSFSFVSNILEKARASLKSGSKRTWALPRVEFDELKRDAALACYAFGHGIFESVAGLKSEFIIQAVDRETGVFADSGGLHFNAVLESRELHYDLDIKDNDDGTYTVSYVPTRIGTYELTVMLEDYDIKGSPFHPKVLPAPVSAPHCLADGTGLFCSIVGVINQFVIHTRNSFNQIVVARGIPFEIVLSKPLVLCKPNGELFPSDHNESTTRDNNDGTYSVFYIVNPTHEDLRRLQDGQHMESHIEIMLDDKIHNPSFSRPIKGSPFRPVLAASATGAALTAAARHATLQYGGGYHNNYALISQFASLASPPLLPQQQQQNSNNNNNNNVSNLDSSFQLNPQQNNLINEYLPVKTKSSSSPLIITSNSVSEYLPIRKSPPTNSFNDSSMLSNESRATIEAEREQLLKLRRELQEGRVKMDEQVGRIANIGKKVHAETEKLIHQYDNSYSIANTIKQQQQTSLKSKTSQPITPLPNRSFDSSVMSLFNKHAPALRRVFRHYSSRDHIDGIRITDFIHCMTDFDITPTFCSKKELRDCFDSAGTDVLDYAGFIDALGFVAITSLGKPMFSHLYTSNAARISVLLVMWGLGDASALDAICAREKYI